MEATALPDRSPSRKVVFILSEMRSGSTWLSYVLGSHSPAAHLGEFFRPFTFENHTACRLCDAKGLSQCEVLYGIEHVERHFAYDFAFAALRKPILIDCSKQLDWIMPYLEQRRFAVQAIHLMRDPRGWFASERRRSPMSVDAAIDRWLCTNRTITDFISSHGIACVTAFYDELAIAPDDYFPSLCDQLGMAFEKPALHYWQSEHHGLGANGAAFNVVGNYELSVVETGDDSFYKNHAGHPFYDDRWPAQINRDERSAIEQSSAISQLLAQYGRDRRHFDQLLECYQANKRTTSNNADKLGALEANHEMAAARLNEIVAELVQIKAAIGQTSWQGMMRGVGQRIRHAMDV